MERPLSEVFSLTDDAVPEINDLRHLEAPEPLVNILAAGARLGVEDTYLARLPHIPYPLFPHLEARGLQWHIHEEEEGSVLILIRRRS
jgi:hypothetical protein